MKKILFPGLFILALIIVSCQTESGMGLGNNNINGKVKNFSDCKQFSTVKENDIPNDQSCIQFNYDNNTLQINHYNAGFNCCPGNISAVFQKEGNTITITEKEEQAGCKCNCLFDVFMEIKDLKPGIYKIVIEELYVHKNDEKLNFEVDLRLLNNSMVCATRIHYPWNVID